MDFVSHLQSERKLMEQIPFHLKRFVVEQEQNSYTPLEHSTWRLILRQLKKFLSEHAHPAYLQGLSRTGISIDSIPSIRSIGDHLSNFGWNAVPVSGFIPPSAFMELQAMSILPIASEMRTLEHLEYTPAPDIVHEAAGHAPMLSHQEYSSYLKNYAKVARFALHSKEDFSIYAAIRELSDLKENPTATQEQIKIAESNLNQLQKKSSEISEAAWLARMNWWTAEYGLFGNLRSQKIYGAGLLSSVGEAKWCLKPDVIKKNLDVKCIEQGYDITEPQPQLFVTESFDQLNQVLDDLSQRMVFRVGGTEGLSRAQNAGTVNTIELNTGLQISGVLTRFNETNENPTFVQMTGPTQLSYFGEQIPGHGVGTHPAGFSSPLGNPNGILDWHMLSDEELERKGIGLNNAVHLKFASGIELRGILKGIFRIKKAAILMNFVDCEVRRGDEILFRKEWGDFDLALGQHVTSVFGGAADSKNYPHLNAFTAKRIPPKRLTPAQMDVQNCHQIVRDALSGRPLSMERAIQCMDLHSQLSPNDWLLVLGLLEVSKKQTLLNKLSPLFERVLHEIALTNPKHKSLIDEGLSLIQ